MPELNRCQALTRAGRQCKNRARNGLAYCHVHRHLAVREEASPVDVEDRFREAVDIIDRLVDRLQEQTPGFVPPPFTPRALVKLLKKNIDRFPPGVQLQVLTLLRDSLKDPSAEDLLDLDAWKGMWYLLNYSLLSDARTLAGGIANRLSGLPGMTLMLDLRHGLAGTRPSDFMALDTWKGLWMMISYSLQEQVDRLRS